MTDSARPRSSPPELAKDILGRLDNAQAALERARAVAERAEFAASHEQITRLTAQVAEAIVAIQAAVRDDVRRRLTAASSSAE